MSNIDTLKSTIKKRQGFASTNRFEVILNFPFIDSSARDLQITCESVNFPGRQIETTDYNQGYRANTIKIPTGYSNEECNLTFRLTNDFFARDLLEKWHRLIFNKDTQRVSYLKEYVEDIEIHSLDKNNNKKYGIKLIDSYPTTIGAIEKTNESQDEILRLQTTFTFKEMDVIGNSIIPEYNIDDISQIFTQNNDFRSSLI